MASRGGCGSPFYSRNAQHNPRCIHHPVHYRRDATRRNDQPGWRNGRRARFRIWCPQGRGGSTPLPGITTDAIRTPTQARDRLRVPSRLPRARQNAISCHSGSALGNSALGRVVITIWPCNPHSRTVDTEGWCYLRVLCVERRAYGLGKSKGPIILDLILLQSPNLRRLRKYVRQSARTRGANGFGGYLIRSLIRKEKNAWQVKTPVGSLISTCTAICAPSANRPSAVAGS